MNKFLYRIIDTNIYIAGSLHLFKHNNPDLNFLWKIAEDSNEIYVELKEEEMAFLKQCARNDLWYKCMHLIPALLDPRIKIPGVEDTIENTFSNKIKSLDNIFSLNALMDAIPKTELLDYLQDCIAEIKQMYTKENPEECVGDNDYNMWLMGDDDYYVKKIEPLMVKYPQMGYLVFIKRNEIFKNKILEILQSYNQINSDTIIITQPTILIIVGCSHLCGKDNLIQILEENNVKISRLKQYSKA